MLVFQAEMPRKLRRWHATRKSFPGKREKKKQEMHTISKVKRTQLFRGEMPCDLRGWYARMKLDNVPCLSGKKYDNDNFRERPGYYITRKILI